MKNKVLAFILSLLLCLQLLPSVAFAEDNDALKEGTITVRNIVTGSENKYTAILEDEKNIYLSANSLAQIAEYTVTYDQDTYWFERISGEFAVTVSVTNRGSVTASGNSYQIETCTYKDTTYFALAEMLYLLRVQWYIENDPDVEDDEILVVQPQRNNILDFFNTYYREMCQNQSDQTDLLMNGEWKITNSVRTSLASVFNDFDAKILVPFWGADAALDDQYEEAILQLAADDSALLDDAMLSNIDSMIRASSFRQLKSSWSSAKDIVDLPENVLKTTDNIADGLKILSDLTEKDLSLRFLPINDVSAISPARLKAISKEMQGISDFLDIAKAAITVKEISDRSDSWGEDFVAQISVLTDFDDTGYTGVADHVKDAANKLVNEYKNPNNAAIDAAVEETLILLYSKIVEQTSAGPILGIISGGIAIAKAFPSVANKIDAADMSYMVNCLIKAEQVAMKETSRSYYSAISAISNGNISQKTIDRLRNCTMLSLRINLRNCAFIYSLNVALNDTENWESSADAAALKNRIARDYALICQLTTTEYQDSNIVPVKLSNMYSTDFGQMRDRIPPELWHEKKSAENNSTPFVKYNNKVYYWEHTADCFAEGDIFGNYHREAGVNSTLVCIDEAGQKETVYQGEGYGNLAIYNDRIYLRSNSKIYSIDMDGQNKKEYGLGDFVGFDEKYEALIYSDNQNIFAIDLNSGESKTLAAWASFMTLQDGTLYYSELDHNANKNEAVKIFAVECDGSNKRHLTTTPSGLYDSDIFQIYSSILIPCVQIDGDYIYISYGSIAGTGSFYQGCAIARFPKEGGNCEILVGGYNNYVGETFYLVSSETQGQKLYYYPTHLNYNSVSCLDLSTMQSSPANFSIAEMGSPFNHDYDYCIYEDSTGQLTTLVAKNDYSQITASSKLGVYDNTLIEVTAAEKIDDYTYFTVTSGTHIPQNDFGWRYYYRRDITNTYRKNNTTGKVELLSTF